MPGHIRSRLLKLTAFACLLGSTLLSSPAHSEADLVRYLMCDVRVMYVYDEPERIDWPTLYYLNDEYGCRIDLVSIHRSDWFRDEDAAVKNLQIYNHRFAGNDTTGSLIDSVSSRLFAARRPDIVLFGAVGDCRPCDSLRSYLISLPVDSTALFNIQKIYALSDTITSGAVGSVVVDSREEYKEYRRRMEEEIPQLFAWFHPGTYTPPLLTRYNLVKQNFQSKTNEADFVSGVRLMRLPGLLDSLLLEGALKSALQKRARNMIAMFRLAQNGIGKAGVEQLLTGYQELTTLNDQTRAESRLSATAGFKAYMNDLVSRAYAAVLDGIGLSWDGKIIVRDSPEGPKLKFRAILTAAGPEEVVLNGIRFEPYWDSVAVPLDSVERHITPHQTFEREFLVNIDASRLEAQMPESLRFAADIVCGKLPFAVSSAVPIWETPDLSIKFEPGFYFVPPVAKLNVDKVVASMTWRAVIGKPTYYYGNVDVHLETPRGVFAGAYQTRLLLEKGSSAESIRIPFSVSNLFEPEIQKQTITLSVDGRPVAADTARICIAACNIADTIKIGFLPDSTGLLEDILRMTGAGFQPLTDRGLLTADLDAYNVIVIGSGAFRDNPSLRSAKGRMGDFLRNGGTILILGQPPDWPQGALPIDLTPNWEAVDRTMILNRIPDANVLKRPYAVADSTLLEFLAKTTDVSSAVVNPGEKVLVTPSGSTLLSVSRLGRGQIIYCGLPLPEMIAALNVDAIHLFANLLNY